MRRISAFGHLVQHNGTPMDGVDKVEGELRESDSLHDMDIIIDTIVFFVGRTNIVSFTATIPEGVEVVATIKRKFLEQATITNTP